jgi:hypothetical protein
MRGNIMSEQNPEYDPALDDPDDDTTGFEGPDEDTEGES